MQNERCLNTLFSSVEPEKIKRYGLFNGHDGCCELMINSHFDQTTKEVNLKIPNNIQEVIAKHQELNS